MSVRASAAGALLLILLPAPGCDQSPFGSRLRPGGDQAIIGRLAATTSACVAFALPGVTEPVGLGYGDPHFYTTDGPTQQIVSFDLMPGRLMLSGTQSAGGAPLDLAVAGGCPYVATATDVHPILNFPPASCHDGSDPVFALGASLIAFDGSSLIRATLEGERKLERYDAQSVFPQSAATLAVVPERLVVLDYDTLLLAYVGATGWDMLAFDLSSLQQRGRVAFPWQGNLDGLSRGPESTRIYVLGAGPATQLCALDYTPAS